MPDALDARLRHEARHRGVTVSRVIHDAIESYLAGAFTVEHVAASDWLRIAELVARYRDLPLGAVDASVVTTAERLDIADVATVDRRHFSVVRPAHAESFVLWP